MSARSWAAGGLAVVALCWGGLGYTKTRPPDFHAYRLTAVESAQSAYHAVVTARVIGGAWRDGRVTGPYAESVLDDGRSALAGAADRFAGATPVDAETVRMRDRLGPLLLAANARLGAVRQAANAKDLAAVGRAVDQLPPVADGLDAFLQAYG
ncbi:hypothetical protein ACGFI9_02650 [Micromonospora sp. NPDC048930]|uniref:hypothetical protein n=1 Tax=Micromonospora sp. NPDC048930 TaxID=3364261 RepID=UPI0037183903